MSVLFTIGVCNISALYIPLNPRLHPHWSMTFLRSQLQEHFYCRYRAGLYTFASTIIAFQLPPFTCYSTINIFLADSNNGQHPVALLVSSFQYICYCFLILYCIF